jgi:hypothetical protein
MQNRDRGARFALLQPEQARIKRLQPARRGGNMRLLRPAISAGSYGLVVWFGDQGAEQVEAGGERAEETPGQPDRDDAVDAPLCLG